MSKKIGCIINFKKDLPIYLKYTNSYQSNNDDLSIIKKDDLISIGSYKLFNNMVMLYRITFSAREFLLLDFKGCIMEFSLGYKFL